MRVQQGPPLPTSFATLNPPAGAGLLGVLTTPGPYPTSIRVTDSLGHFGDRPITITVPPLQILSQTNLPKAKWDSASPYSFQLTPYGGSGYSFSLASGSLPNNVTLISSGLISGTPTGSTTTATFTFAVTLTAAGGQSFTSSNFSLTVNAFDITASGVSPAGSGVLPRGTVGVGYSQTFLGAGCTGTCLWSISGQPNTLSLDPATGVLSGTPTSTTNTSFTVTRNSTLGNGTVSRVFSLQIVPASTTVLSITSPTATNPATGSFFPMGISVAQGLFAAGGIPPYAWTLDSGTLPTGVTLQSGGDPSTLGRDLVPGLSYLAGRAMVAGTYTFTLKATDFASNFVTRTYAWTVAALNNQYTSLPLSGTTLVAGTPYTQTLLGLGGTATEGTGNYAWANLSPLPLGLTLTPGGVLSGTTFESGSVTVPVRITDTTSLVKLVSNVTLTITGPVVIGGGSAVSFTTGSTLSTAQAGSLVSTSIGVTGGTPFAATPGPSYILTVESPTALPPGFTLLTADGLPAGGAAGSTVLSGTPSSPGVYTFTLRATDLVGNFSLRTFALTVLPLALATNTTLPDGGVGESYSQRLLAWDNTSAVVWSVSNGSSLPPGLSLVAGVLTTGAGTLTQAGSFTFSLDATDASGAVLSGNYNLKVTSFRITSPQELPEAVYGVPFSYQFTASAAATWQANSGLPSGSPGFNLSPTGLLTGTLSSVGSPFSFTVQATVGGVSQVRRFVLYQRLPNRAVLDLSIGQTLLIDATVGLSAAYSLTPNGGTPPYAWSVGSALPPGFSLVSAASVGSPTPTNFVAGFYSSATLNPGGSVLAGTPSAAGDYSFDLILTDSLGAVSRRTFSLHVSQVSILQSGLNPAKVNAAYSRQFTAAGGTGAYTFTMSPAGRTQDMLPPGLSLTTGGLLAGTPTSTGSYAFFLQAKDGLNRTFTRRYGLFVTNNNLLFVSNFNQFDTPVGVDTRLTNNPRSLTLAVSLLTVNANGSAGGNSPASGTFTWTLKNGSLPPGMSLLTGDLYADPGQTVLGGQPTTAGTFVFTLTATKDGSPGNVADHTFTFRIAPMQAVAPPTEAGIAVDLSPAHVGEFYSTTLKMAGGTLPYSFVKSPFVPLPDWLTLEPTGVLWGTPPAGAIGSYFVSAIVTDGTLNELNFISLLVVTSGVGAAAPLQSLPQNLELPYGSAGLPYNYPLDFVLRGGTGPFTWSVAPIPNNALPPGLVLLPGTNGVSTYLSGMPFSDEFRFSLVVQDSGSPQQSLTVALLLEVPSLALTPDTLAPGIVGVPYGPVTLTPSGGTDPYTVFAYPLESDFPPGLSLGAPNCAVLQLCGTPTAPGNFPIVVALLDSAGQALGRSYRFVVDNPTIAQPLGEAPGVNLTPTPIEVSYRVGDPNPAPTPFSVNATSGTFAYGLSIAGVPGASLSSGTGTAPGGSSLLWNMTGVAIGTYRGVLGVRAPGAVNLVDQVPVTLRVTVPCNYALNPSSGSAAAAGGSGAFGMATGGDCAWTAASNAPWITVTSASSGAGSATINYSVAPNDNETPLDSLDDPLVPRVGTINVHGQIFSITQFGSDCAFGISPSNLSVPASGGQAVVSVTASNSGCQWTASGLGATWANAPTPVSGNGTVTVTIPANPLPQNMPLQTATIAGLTFTVYQSGAVCNVGLSASSASSPAGGGPGQVSVTRVDGCAYDTVVGPSWVSVTSGGSHDDSFSGPPLTTLLNYEVQPNSTTIARSGTLTIGGQSFQINQDGLACSVTLDTSNLGSPYGPGPFAGSVGTIGVTANGTNCSWVADSGAEWASISPSSGGGLSSTIQVRVTGNQDSLTSRTTDLSIAGQIVSIVQAGLTCTYGTQSSTGSFPASGGFGTVGVIAPSLCGWTVQSNDPLWLTVVSPLAPGSAGSTNILFSVAANGPVPPTPRVGTFSVKDALDQVVRTYTVTQQPQACSYTLPQSGVTLPSGGTVADSFAFSADAGCTPTAVSYASWVTVVNPVGAGSVEYSVEPNPTAQLRKGTIQLGNTTFTITEQGAVCGYSINPYGLAFGTLGGPGTVFGTTTSLFCTPDVTTDQPSFISLANPPTTEDPVTHLFTLPYTVLPYSSVNPNVRYGNITFGGRVHTVKQTSW